MITSSIRPSANDGKRRRPTISVFWFVPILTLVVIYIDFKMTRGNMQVPWNGHGAVRSVLDGVAKAPMRYRVLVPWLVAPAKDALVRYLYVKWWSILFATFASFTYFLKLGVDPYLCTSLLALFMLLSAIYDYADAYLEIGLLASAFLFIGNSLVVVMVLTFVAALNRETAVVIPLAVALEGWVLGTVLVGGCFWVGYAIPRLKYGKAERYCEFFTFKRNWQTIKESRKVPLLLNEYFHFALLLTAVVIVYSLSLGSLTPVETALGLLFVGLLIPTMWREIRVFAPTMLVVIPMAVGRI